MIKKILVTGTSSGLGYQIAKRLSKKILYNWFVEIYWKS